MAELPIRIDELIQSGRTNAPDPTVPRVVLTYNADMSVAFDKSLDLRALNQSFQTGVIRSIFVDNGTNPNEIQVSVSITDQYFTVPPYAEGTFLINSADQSTIHFVSDGGASDIVTIQFMNWEAQPIIYYTYGPSNINEPVKVYGSMTPGDTVALETTNTPVFIGAIDGTGVFRSVLCDATGKLEMAGTISISSIVIADGNDSAFGATTTAPIESSATNGAFLPHFRGYKKIFGERADAANSDSTATDTFLAFFKGLLQSIGRTTSATQVDPTTNANLISYIRGILSTLLDIKTRAGTGTTSQVASGVASVTILAANANRKGASIQNSDANNLFLRCSAAGAASTTVFTIRLAQWDYFEVPAGYTGIIVGIWDVDGAGSAIVTEYT